MALFGGMSEQNNLSEINRTGFGYTAAQRKAAARLNLGLGGGVGASTTRNYFIPAMGNSKVGATSGWLVTATDNIGHATCPASKTASTLVIGVPLEVGDIVTGFNILAQVQSVGGIVTIDADFRSQVIAASDFVDASVGAITQVSVTAQTASQAAKTFVTPATCVAGTHFYVLITATTAASTDIDLGGIVIYVKKA